VINICGVILGSYLTVNGAVAWKRAGFAIEGKFAAYQTGMSAFLGIVAGLGLLGYTLWNVFIAAKEKMMDPNTPVYETSRKDITRSWG
jgi:hypothetical protein